MIMLVGNIDRLGLYILYIKVYPYLSLGLYFIFLEFTDFLSYSETSCFIFSHDFLILPCTVYVLLHHNTHCVFLSYLLGFSYSQSQYFSGVPHFLRVLFMASSVFLLDSGLFSSKMLHNQHPGLLLLPQLEPLFSGCCVFLFWQSIFLSNFLRKGQLCESLLSENVSILPSHEFGLKFWHLSVQVKNFGIILETI